MLVGGIALIVPSAACAANQASSTPTTGASTTTGTSPTASAIASVAVGATSGASMTLGVTPPGGHSQGYGAVKPATLDDGGDGSQVVTGVTWSSWGGATASGHGTGTYVPEDQPLANGTSAPVTIIASDPGSCQGHRAYRRIAFYYPSKGQSPSDAQSLDICGWNA
jgi:hypothetical protein